MSHARIHPNDLMSQKNDTTCIIDVRTAAEVNSACLAGCLHIPLHELTPETLKKVIENNGKDISKIYLLCQAGRRAEMAADQLKGKIDAEFIIIDGGVNGVQQANIPLIGSGKQPVSLERQVRITAGILVLIGAILGTWVNPMFYGLSAFVGAGLTFAGITNTCAMGMIIARMPWNK